MTQRTPTLEKVYESRPWLDLSANDSFIMSAVGHPITFNTLLAVADRLDSQQTLAIVDEYAQGWADFLAVHPEFEGEGTHGNRCLAFQLLNLYEPPTVEAFEAIADRESRPLTVSSVYSAQQAEQAERVQLIKALGDQPKFLSLSLDQLRREFAVVTENERLQSLTPEQIRQELRSAEQQRIQAANTKPELPETWRVLVDSDRFKRNEVIPLTKENFMLLERGDMRVLLNTYGHAQIDTLLGVKPRTDFSGQSFSFTL